MAKAISGFTQAARAARNKILPLPLTAPVVQEPPLGVVPTVLLVLVEPRVLSAMREVEKHNPPTFFGYPDLVEAKLWLKRIVRIFEHIEPIEGSSSYRCRYFPILRKSPDLVGTYLDD